MNKITICLRAMRLSQKLENNEEYKTIIGNLNS